VVFEVLANVRCIEQNRNAVLLEQRCRPDPESCSSCGVLIAPPARSTSRFAPRFELLAAAQVLDADRTRSFEQDPRSQRARDDRRGSACVPRAAGSRSQWKSAGRGAR
jgi:hypothetical protein